jgi:hypothetical protein
VLKSASIPTIDPMQGEDTMKSLLVSLFLIMIALDGRNALAHESHPPLGQDAQSGPQTTIGLMSEEVLQQKLKTQSYVPTGSLPKAPSAQTSRQQLPVTTSGLEGPAHRAYVYEITAVKDGSEVILEIDALTGQIREKGMEETPKQSR